MTEKLSLEQAQEDLEEHGFSADLQMIDRPTTHHTSFGAVRVVPLEDGGFLLGVKPPEELEHPPGYPPEEGYITVQPGTFADEAAAEIAQLLAEHYDEVPESYIQRVNIEVEDLIEVTFMDPDRVKGKTATGETQ